MTSGDMPERDDVPQFICPEHESTRCGCLLYTMAFDPDEQKLLRATMPQLFDHLKPWIIAQARAIEARKTIDGYETQAAKLLARLKHDLQHH